MRSSASAASKAGKKVDRVARYQQLQAGWTKDRCGATGTWLKRMHACGCLTMGGQGWR